MLQSVYSAAMRLDFRGKTHVLTKKHPILRLVVSVKSAQGAKFNNNYAPCAVKLNATTSFTVFYCLRRTLCRGREVSVRDLLRDEWRRCNRTFLHRPRSPPRDDLRSYPRDRKYPFLTYRREPNPLLRADGLSRRRSLLLRQWSTRVIIGRRHALPDPTLPPQKGSTDIRSNTDVSARRTPNGR